jgi:penicillin-binding protein 1A
VNFLGWCAATIALLLLVAVVAGVALYRQFERRAEQFDLSKMDQVPERSTIVDANGDHYTYVGGENRFVVSIYEVSKNFVNALLAREDSRFWQHEGVDLIGVVRAAITNARSGETKQGASTITQQLARNACELKARTLDRKALEAMIARRIEKEYTKEQILELYVNRIYFGSGYYGIETASRGYFGKHASELTVGEGAALAGLIRSPGRLSPANDLAASERERNEVVDRMLELTMVTSDEAAAAKAQQLAVAKQNRMRVTDDYVSDAVLGNCRPFSRLRRSITVA